MSVIVQAKGIVKKYNGLTAVDGIDFEVNEGEVLGILGPNGAGKTSLVKMLYNLVKRNSGQLSVFGMDPFKDEVKVKYFIGIVPQEDNLDQDLSVIENLIIYSNYFGIPYDIALRKINDLLVFFELTGKENYNINALSGGMKRRLVIIRALLNSPKLLLLDEPTTGLDPAVRHLIWDKFRELKKQGITIIITTHYMEEASGLCDRLFIMDKGRIIINGNPHDLIERYFEKYVLEMQFEENMYISKDIRFEKHGSRFYYYSNDEKELFALKECLKNKNIIIRNATLEDLFLKLTGRNLDE